MYCPKCGEGTVLALDKKDEEKEDDAPISSLVLIGLGSLVLFFSFFFMIIAIALGSDLWPLTVLVFVIGLLMIIGAIYIGKRHKRSHVIERSIMLKKSECDYCGGQNRSRARKCEFCGAPLKK